ncbi:MAG TPA: hypothetical protein V6D26_10055 [Stenomitos sp.]
MEVIDSDRTHREACDNTTDSGEGNARPTLALLALRRLACPAPIEPRAALVKKVQLSS